jgi:hypothetical protein
MSAVFFCQPQNRQQHQYQRQHAGWSVQSYYRWLTVCHPQNYIGQVALRRRRPPSNSPNQSFRRLAIGVASLAGDLTWTRDGRREARMDETERVGIDERFMSADRTVGPPVERSVGRSVDRRLVVAPTWPINRRITLLRQQSEHAADLADTPTPVIEVCA